MFCYYIVNELVARLIEEARQNRLSLDAYLLQTILRQKSANGSADETERRRAREEAGRSIRELRKGNVLGPELTIPNLVEEGRRF